MRKIASLAALCFFVVAMTGCGGGESAPVAEPPPNPPVDPLPPATVPGDLQTGVAMPTYPAGSEELAFFTLLNGFRSQLGLGLLAQSDALDKASQNHVQYMLINNDVDYAQINPTTGKVYMHEEDPARPGYTGVAPIDRAKFARYDGGWVGEQVAYGMGGGAARDFGALVASVYHREGLMFQFPRDFGISVGADPRQTTVLIFGGTEGKWQRNGSDYFGVYPADKQTGVGLSTYPELPNPYPEITLSQFATMTSYPVSVAAERSTTLKVDSFTLTEAGQSAPLDARVITADNDPNKLLGKHAAYLVGKAPFNGGTTYNVSFKGSVNGAPVSKSWSFTTVQ